jgi:hypothetical protein
VCGALAQAKLGFAAARGHPNRRKKGFLRIPLVGQPHMVKVDRLPCRGALIGKIGKLFQGFLFYQSGCPHSANSH